MKKVIYCFMVLSFLLSGCGNGLSKGDAKDMIKTFLEKEHRYPMYASFAWQYFGNYQSWNLTAVQIEQLSNDNYLQIPAGYNNSNLVANFSKKSAPFNIVVTNGNQQMVYLQLATIDKVVVNNITCGDVEKDYVGHTSKLCEAKYEIKFKPNAIGEKIQLDFSKLAQAGKAHFKLEDNVWTAIGVYVDQTAR